MSTKNVGKPLTAGLVFTKTKSDSLQNIKNLNLWGNELEDLTLIQKMPNLQVISLSVNKISSLKYFACCQKLQELYLRKNNIADIHQIRYLVNLPSLKVLWLHDNPCAQINNYRQIVIKHLPNLMKLDNNIVAPQEKIASKNLNFILQSPKTESKQEKQCGEEKQQNYSRKQKSYQNSAVVQQKYQSQRRNAPQQQGKYKQKLFKKAGIEEKNNIYEPARTEDLNRNQNILMAILSLMRQLDSGSLQIVKRQASKMQSQY